MFANPDLSLLMGRRVITHANEALALDRRSFVRLVLLSGVGLSLGGLLTAGGAAAKVTGGDGGGVAMPFVSISPANVVTVIIKHLDKGQGIATGLATLVAEELDADWSQVKSDFAPADTATYQNLAFGVQGTGGSTSIANSFEQYRKAGAAARAMIVAAAARVWKVAPETVTVSKGVVTSGANTATLGELADLAAKEEVPQSPKLKEPSQFTLIGKEGVQRLDSPMKTAANKIFTQDVQLPGMLVATLRRSPRFGGTLKSLDDTAARAVKGVVDVVTIPQGVAVIATSTYAAIQGREALSITWDDSKAEMRSSDQIVAEYKLLAGSPGLVAKDGDAEGAIAKAQKVIEAEYVFPFLAHAPMEPMNAVVQYKGGKVSVWTGSQMQTIDQAVAAGIFGVKPENVAVTTLWAGGSFGRRATYNGDYVGEAAAIVKASGKDVPIKLVWTREDDIQGGYYRPLYVHKVKVGLDKDGAVVGWHHRIVGQSIIIGTPFEAALVKDGIDVTSIEGVSTTPYAIPNMRVEVHNTKAGPPPLWWRSVGHTHTAYVMETMIDEIARVAGKDPVAYRLSLLEKHPRHAGVLKLAAEKAGWGSALPEGVSRGVAVHESFQSYVAEVAEVRLVEGRPKVERVVAAVDCGLAINPDNIRAQVEGGIGFGLGAVLKSKVTLKDGLVEEGNFDSYEVLRISEMPKVEVHIVASAEAPTGIGEPGTPPIGPAVANAIAHATGKRVRVLPMAEGLKLA